MTFNWLDRKQQSGAKFCHWCIGMTNWGQRILHTSENRSVPNKGNIYEHPDEALRLPSRPPETLKQTGVTFRLRFKPRAWQLSSDSRKNHFQLRCVTGLSDISSYSSNIYEKKQKWWARSISGTWHCIWDKNGNAMINNFCIISDRISNVVLSLIFVTYISSAENTEEVS